MVFSKPSLSPCMEGSVPGDQWGCPGYHGPAQGEISLHPVKRKHQGGEDCRDSSSQTFDPCQTGIGGTELLPHGQGL